MPSLTPLGCISLLFCLWQSCRHCSRPRLRKRRTAGDSASEGAGACRRGARPGPASLNILSRIHQVSAVASGVWLALVCVYHPKGTLISFIKCCRVSGEGGGRGGGRRRRRARRPHGRDHCTVTGTRWWPACCVPVSGVEWWRACGAREHHRRSGP